MATYYKIDMTHPDAQANIEVAREAFALEYPTHVLSVEISDDGKTALVKTGAPVPELTGGMLGSALSFVGIRGGHPGAVQIVYRKSDDVPNEWRR